MNSNSRLVPASIKAQCNAGIEQLNADNAALNIANQSIDDFINDKSIKSISYNSMKQQLTDYKSVIHLLKLANDSDIMDYSWLYNLVGCDVLSGVVVDIKSINESNLQAANDNAQLYYQKAKEETNKYNPRKQNFECIKNAESYRASAKAYEEEASTYQATIDYCKSIIEKYDSIEENTKNLFTESVVYRQIARSALLDMKTTFHNDMYVPHQLAPWRQAYADCLKVEEFKNALKTQFGFDDKTVSVLYSVYDAIQTKYASLPQEERDWYFTRSISQMAGYNNQEIWGIETHAWRKGAGWAYGYGIEDEKKFFCETLGIATEDYEYMRQMVRLQHLMVSEPDEYGAEEAQKNFNDSDKIYTYQEFLIWKHNMEEATNFTYTDSEYWDYYTQLYNMMGDKGDFSHMLYTISAGLIDEGKEVDNKWTNIGALYMSWENKEERVDITGWLGDAIYTGDNDKVSFANDDFISDLDADNMIHRMSNGKTLIDNMTQYYKDVSIGVDDDVRINEFLLNNSYENVLSSILDRIDVKDVNKDGIYNLEDIKDSDTYADTYKFLVRLKEYKEGENNESN